MRDEKVITPAQASEAQAYPLRLATRVEAGEVAPYFVEWIRQQLDDKFGKQLYEQGLKVYTTLDLDMQIAGRAVDGAADSRDRGGDDTATFPHITLRAVHRAGERRRSDATAPTRRTCRARSSRWIRGPARVRALVGGRDFDDSKFDRAVQAVRQPGSTFKPIVYADAMQNGRPLSYMLDDSPLTVQLDGSPPWTPQNFEGDYAGKIPMRRALYQSRNVPTIRLGMELGMQSVIDEARQVRSDDADPRLSVDLHRRGRCLSDRDGRRVHRRSRRSARARSRWRSRASKIEGQRALGAGADAHAGDVARRSVADGQRHEGRRAARHRGGERRFTVPLSGRRQDRHDERRHRRLVHRLHVGSRRRRVDGLRQAAEDQGERAGRNSRRAGVDGVHERGLQRKPAPRDWPMPPDIVTRQIDVSTNMLATPYCPPTVVGNEFFIPGTDPVLPCDVHNGCAVPGHVGRWFALSRQYAPAATLARRSFPSASVTVRSLRCRSEIRRVTQRENVHPDSLRRSSAALMHGVILSGEANST